MKKYICFFLTFSWFSLITFSQDSISIRVNAVGVNGVQLTYDLTDYSSGHSPFIYDVIDGTSQMIQFDFEVENNTSSNKSWQLIRFNEADVSADWFTHLSFATNCYPSSPLNPWCSPNNALAILHSASASVEPFDFDIAIGTHHTSLINCI